MRSVRRFFRNESGAAAIEYGLIAGAICIGLLASLQPIGTKLNSIFSALLAAFG